MKIRRVGSFLLSYPLPEPVVMNYYGGVRTIHKRDAMLVRIEAENGLIGYGPGQGSESAHQHIRDSIAPFLEGRILKDADALRIQFQKGCGSDGELLKIYSMVEVALYDLLGKFHGVPVSELLGGRIREKIRLYGSAGMYQPPEEYAAEAARIAGRGFKAYKMRPALGPEDDIRTVELMRDAIGPGLDLMVDAHSWWRMGDRSYSFETIQRVAEAMSEFDIAWLEEPLPPHDHDAYRRMREQDLVPLASGEHEPSEERFEDLVLGECVDFVQMDIVCQGGFSVCRRLLSQVAHMGQRFAFHSWGTDLEVAAAAQIGVCWPETVVEWLEYPVYSDDRVKSMYPFPLAQQILKEPLAIAEGELSVSRKAGLGVDVDESVIDRYPWIPGPWSFFELISPPGKFAVVSDHSIPWAENEPR